MLSVLRWWVVVWVLVVCVACANSDTPEDAPQSSEAVTGVAGSQSVESSADDPVSDRRDESDDTAFTNSNSNGQDIEQLGERSPEEETSLVGETSPATTIQTTTTTTFAPLDKEYPSFGADGADTAPRWPFRGLVQLWYNTYSFMGELGWSLRYWSWDTSAEIYPQVPLPGLEIECMGRIGMVTHGELGIEIGGITDTASSTYWIPWGDTAAKVDTASEMLLTQIRDRSSSVEVATEGDWVHLTTGTQQQSYEIRDPMRPDGDRWTVQARHDGELFLLTVHPAHLPCYSGVTWVSLAATGEFVTCGANTAATLFVSPEPPAGELILPDPDTMGTYLSCAPQLDLTNLPFTQDRQLTPPH